VEFKFGSLWVEFKICPPGVLLVGVAFMGACSPVSVWGRGGTNVEEEEGGEGDLCVVEECLSRCFLEKWYTIPPPGVLLVGVAFMGACSPVSVWGRGGTNVEEEEGGEGDLCVVEECLSRCFLEKWYTIPTPIQSPAMLTSVRNRSN
jgi:hypothetical protein